MAAVFISYRRDDSEGQARTLFRDLSEILGRNAVFMDVDSIALGRDFREVLQERLASSAASRARSFGVLHASYGIVSAHRTSAPTLIHRWGCG